MDRALNALVNLDVPGDIVRIDIRGSLDQGSRPQLGHIVRRIRRMGIRSHIRVGLSGAALVESSALAGLRTDLNAIDAGTLPGLYGSGVSLDLSHGTGEWTAEDPRGQELSLLEGLADGGGEAGDLAEAFPLVPSGSLEELGGRPLREYSDEELLSASDSIFALLDNPKVFPGSDLLGRYSDIGEELRRRRQEAGTPFPAAEGQAAS